MVHPDLSLHLHPLCKDVITKLHSCHKDHAVAKFWGKCNKYAWELDRCLQEEYVLQYEEKLKDIRERQKKKKAQVNTD